jgi:hypothetical protein
MRTRSQTKNQNIEIKVYNSDLFKVEIDFDEASEAWKANKKSIGNGSYKYICFGKTKTGNNCKRESLSGCDYCKIHKK